jgi:hypothetical protein
MSPHASKSSTGQQEERISRLEKRDAAREAPAENGAPATAAKHIERPHDLREVIEDAIAFVRNDSQSTDVAKGRALAYIAGIAARILPLLEQEQLQEEDWETTRKGEETLFDLAASDPRVGEAIDTLIECVFGRSTRTGEQLTITDEPGGWKVERDARQG